MLQFSLAFFQMSLTPPIQLLMFKASRFWLLWKLVTFLTPSTRSPKLKLNGFLTQSKKPLLLPSKTVSPSPISMISTSSPRFLAFCSPVLMPIIPYIAMLPSRVVVLCLSNSQPISPSTPKLKQLQKCLVSCFPEISLSSLLSTFENWPLYNTQTYTSQRSRYYCLAFVHSLISCFSYWKEFQVRVSCLPPHPRFLEKSLPVPRGMMAMLTFSGSMAYLAISETTHITVPSPPHITAMTSLSWLVVCLRCLKPGSEDVRKLQKQTSQTEPCRLKSILSILMV